MEHDEKIKIENHFEAGSMTGCNVFAGTVNGGIFPLPGSHPTINNYFGMDEHKQQTAEKTSERPEEQVEDPEKRAKRKEAVITSITSLFDFDEESFCRDDKGNRITNKRFAVLFSRCFGFGAHPSRDLSLVIEQLWVLLIDKRNQCFKNPNEDYFRQTVLNILGYFIKKGVLSGNKLDISRTIYKDADESLAKNVERGITSNVFPLKTADLLDLYIDKLLKGDF